VGSYHCIELPKCKMQRRLNLEQYIVTSALDLHTIIYSEHRVGPEVCTDYCNLNYSMTACVSLHEAFTLQPYHLLS